MFLIFGKKLTRSTNQFSSIDSPPFSKLIFMNSYISGIFLIIIENLFPFCPKSIHILPNKKVIVLQLLLRRKCSFCDNKFQFVEALYPFKILLSRTLS